MRRIWSVVAILLLALTVSAASTGDQAAEVQVLQCVPPDAVLVPPGMSPSGGPPTAVVDTRVRPKRTRLYLDGRYIGPASDFDGWPSNLFLFPGRYRIEARLDGYRSAFFELGAEPGCLFQLRHRMERVPGTPRDPWWRHPERPYPFEWVFAPRAEGASETGQAVSRPTAPGGVRGRGANLELRPDVGETAVKGGPSPAVGRVRLVIEPAQAAVYLDGEMVGSAESLRRMAGGLEVAEGEHVVEAMAPGFEPSMRRFVIDGPGELELAFSLRVIER